MTEQTTFDLGGGGGNTFSFGKPGAQPGAYVQGTVLDMKEVQSTDYKTNKPEFWDNGDPKMQFRVTLQTEERDPTNTSDDGKRNVFLDGRRKPYDHGGKSKLCAVLDAVQQVTGGTSLQFGAKLTLQWVSGMGVEGDPRCFQAWYEAPAFPMTQPPEARQAPPMPPVTQQQAAFVPPQQGPAPDWAQQPQTAPVVSTATGQPVVHHQQVPPPPMQQQPSAAVQAANPYAGPPATQQPAPGVQGSWTGQPAPQQAQQAPPPPQQQLTPTQIAGTVGAPISPEQIAGVQALGQDPAAVFGPDWQSRIQPA